MKRKSCWVIFLVGMVISLTACSKDEDDRDDFVGTWKTQETFTYGEVYTYDYNFSITKSSTAENKILLNGFSDESGVTVEASVSGKSFTIAQQTVVVDGESVGISGSGSRDGNRLTYSYTLSTLGYAFNISGIANKL